MSDPKSIVQQACDEMGLGPVPDDAVSVQVFADDAGLDQPQVFSAAWKAEVAVGRGCNEDADTSQTSWAPVLRYFSIDDADTLTQWLGDNVPKDAAAAATWWAALWTEYHKAVMPSPTPPKTGDYCREHGIDIVDMTMYSTAEQLALETRFSLEAVLHQAGLAGTPFVEVCNPDFEAELAAHSAGERAEGGRPTVWAMASGNVETFIAYLQDKYPERMSGEGN